MIIASLPVLELRWAIPQGLIWGMPIYKVYFLSVLGNLIPVIPILFALEPFSKKIENVSFFKKFYDWIYVRTEKKAKVIQRYEIWGLILFVAIPLPGTGAWTGTLAAKILKMKLRYAFLGISLGVIIAGLIVSILLSFGLMTYHLLIP